MYVLAFNKAWVTGDLGLIGMFRVMYRQPVRDFNLEAPVPHTAEYNAFTAQSERS